MNATHELDQPRPIAEDTARLLARAGDPRAAEQVAQRISCFATAHLRRLVELGLTEQQTMRLGQPLEPQVPAAALRLLAAEAERRGQAEDPMRTVLPALSPDQAHRLNDETLALRSERLVQQREHLRELAQAHNADVERWATAQPSPDAELLEAARARLERLNRVRRSVALGLAVARREHERRAHPAAVAA